MLPLPPRTRGRRAAGDGQAGHAASTPAHAGPAAPEPETSSPADPLPPRTRGRRDDPDRSGVQKASTPAHAGPAPTPFRLIRALCLYPRARGAGVRGRPVTAAMTPLPPRTRGRLPLPDPQQRPGASTPAHAGPAVGVDASGRPVRLYPRARGAGGARSTTTILPDPLPPRTRGRPGMTPPSPPTAALYPRARGAGT